jgi:hypothetical protein
MAGSYPDPPGIRIEYDKDGSGMVHWDGTVLTPLTVPQMQATNKETANSTGWRCNNGEFMACMFPSPMTLTAIYTCGNQGGASHANAKYQASTDTTTGSDGTWSDVSAVFDSSNGNSTINPDYRTLTHVNWAVFGTPLVGVKGIRVIMTSNGSAGWDFRNMHVYGYRTADTGNWLTLWHPSLNQPLSDTPGLMDLGNLPRNTGDVNFTFRVKNSSTLLSANGITLSRDALTDGTPSIVTSTTLNYNSGAFDTTAAVGDLGPGAISQLCGVRVNISATAPIGIWATPRILATTTSWI